MYIQNVIRFFHIPVYLHFHRLPNLDTESQMIYSSQATQTRRTDHHATVRKNQVTLKITCQKLIVGIQFTQPSTI